MIADLACISIRPVIDSSAPVFDYLDTPDVLVRGWKPIAAWSDRQDRDSSHADSGDRGLLSKCRAKDYETAAALVAPDAAAVFRMHDSFCEPATHRRWAVAVLERARVFGVKE